MGPSAKDDHVRGAQPNHRRRGATRSNVAAMCRLARREGYGGMVILNLYAFPTKDPKVMMSATDPAGPDNDRVLADVTGAVIAGWGTNADPARVTRALALLPQLHALGVTKDGHSRHPLCVPADAPLVEWRS